MAQVEPSPYLLQQLHKSSMCISSCLVYFIAKGHLSMHLFMKIMDVLSKSLCFFTIILFQEAREPNRWACMVEYQGQSQMGFYPYSINSDEEDISAGSFHLDRNCGTASTTVLGINAKDAMKLRNPRVSSFFKREL